MTCRCLVALAGRASSVRRSLLVPSWCDVRQYGQTCGLPLGRNCPWVAAASGDGIVPQFFTLLASPLEAGATRRLFTVGEGAGLGGEKGGASSHPA